MSIRVLEFKTEFKGVGEAATSVEWVRYAPVGSIQNTATWARIKDLKPDKAFRNDDEGLQLQAQRIRWSFIEPAYDAWKSGEELPTTGTALAAWPGISADVAEAFKRGGVKTIEEVAGLTDVVLGRLAVPNARSYVAQAKLFLESVDKSEMADRMDKKDREMQQLREELLAAKELLEELVAKKGGKIKEAA
jgi:hypothetical protein